MWQNPLGSYEKIRKAHDELFHSITQSDHRKGNAKAIIFSFLNLILESRARSDVDQSTTEASANGGESYFVSDKMFDSMNVCRCGRKKEGTHLIKCLQKSIIKYSDGQVSTGSSPVGGDKDELKPNIPRTSNEIFGFFHSKYVNLERSTFYVTPKANLRHKITDQIYESIIIGWI